MVVRSAPSRFGLSTEDLALLGEDAPEVVDLGALGALGAMD